MGIVSESGKSILPPAIALFILAWLAPPATAGDTLTQIKSRGMVRCGVSEGIAGFSAKDASGRWTGLNVDFCRAVAAAALGNAEKVTFIPLKASERFPALQTGVIDLLLRNTTWTLSREAGLKVEFAGVLFYDREAFMVPKANGPRTIAELNGATICVEKGTTHAQNLADYFAAQRLNVTPLVIDSATGVADAFFAGRCRAYMSDASQLTAARLRAPGGPQAFVILPDAISKQPFAPVMRRGDDDWVTLVRWVLFALIAAEEHGITRDNVRAMRGSADNPAVRRALGESPKFGRALGTDPDWALRAVESVGNYGEMFERNLGTHSPLNLERGLNRLWTDGGLMYAPAMR
jgi:general L-amino acid transport system substrate-binding protein